MKNRHYVIYIPGLEDVKFAPAQIRALRLWKIYDLDVEYELMRWANKESFAPKLERILEKIDAHANDSKVSLVGVSAGASAAVNAYAARKDKIHCVVCICGKLRNPQTVHPLRYEMNPAFKGSMDLLPKSLEKLSPADRTKILSAHPIKDPSVPPEDTLIEGARSSLMLSVGHGRSIAYALTLGSFRLARFIKKLR